MPLAEELVADIDRLVSLPTQYLRVREALADPDASTTALAESISREPALAAALLRLANSAFYGYSQRIDTLTRAISLIGLEQLADIVLAHSVTQTFNGIRPQRMDMQRFWRSSVRRALLCAAACDERDRARERLFTLGLLSDLGHLVLYHTQPDLMGILLDRGASDLFDLARQEEDLIGCDFAAVGAALAARWKLPPVFGGAIGAQLQPASAGVHSQDAWRLHVAALLDDAIERDVMDSRLGSAGLAEALARAGLAPDWASVQVAPIEAQLVATMTDFGFQPG